MTRDSSGLTGPRKPGRRKRSAAGLTGRQPAFTPEPDPLETVEYTGDLAQDTAAEFTALEGAYQARRRHEDQRFKRATDSEYWVAVCFTSREEKDRFLERADLTDLGDKYLNGPAVANRLGIDLN